MAWNKRRWELPDYLEGGSTGERPTWMMGIYWSSIKEAIIKRDKGVCTWDGCDITWCLAVHHIIPKVRGGTEHPNNLRTLCQIHHGKSHSKLGIYKKHANVAWKDPAQTRLTD